MESKGPSQKFATETISPVHILTTYLRFTLILHSHKDQISKVVSSYKVKVKLFLCFSSKHHAIKAYWEIGGIAPRISTSALDGSEWSASRPVALPQGKQTLVPTG
jgi:hypothetical protein